MVDLVKKRKTFYFISAMLSLAAVLCIAVFGLNFGIDFTGGALLEVKYQNQAPATETIRQALTGLDLGAYSLQKTGQTGVLLKAKEISETTHQQILEKLQTLGQLESGSESFQTIGPLIGQELKEKTKVVSILSLLIILVYIALAFRKISRPVKSYVYGITSVIALCHDVLIPLGVLAVLGRYYGAEISIPIITAFLTIFGYSINDSVVVFDRLRENLIKSKTGTFAETMFQAIKQTMARSLNTTITTLLSLLAILIFGGASLRYFALTLILGIALGAYSSIFLATPLALTYEKWRAERRQAR